MCCICSRHLLSVHENIPWIMHENVLTFMYVYWHQRRACVELTKFTVHMNCTSSADNCRKCFILGTWLALTSTNFRQYKAYPVTVQLSVGLCCLLNRCFCNVSIFVTWTEEVYDIRNVTGRAENVTEGTDWVSVLRWVHEIIHMNTPQSLLIIYAL